jgi:hypothetical protein
MIKVTFPKTTPYLFAVKNKRGEWTAYKKRPTIVTDYEVGSGQKDINSYWVCDGVTESVDVKVSGYKGKWEDSLHMFDLKTGKWNPANPKKPSKKLPSVRVMQL